jgi:hypothetical protein
LTLTLGIIGLSIFFYLFTSNILRQYLIAKFAFASQTAIVTLNQFYFAPSVLNYLGVVLFIVGTLFTLGVLYVMKDYTFNINALEVLGKEAMKRGNAQVLDLIDSLFLSAGLSNQSIIPAFTGGMFRKLVQSPSALTRIGSAIGKDTISPVSSALISSGSAGIQSLGTD